MLAQQPLRLHQVQASSTLKDKSLTCFGAYCQQTGDLYLDFAKGYPNSEQMWHFICRLLSEAKRLHKKVLLILWDNAPWHSSKRIKRWIRRYNRWAKAHGKTRLLVFWLPRKSPWLNPIEPHWAHAKRQVCEPSGDLSLAELKHRVAAYFQARSLTLHSKP